MENLFCGFIFEQMSIQDIFGMIQDRHPRFSDRTFIITSRSWTTAKYNTTEDKKMKKIITLLVAMVMCVNLVACGGVDTQPAIDAYNELCDNYNKFVELGNASIDEVDEEDIDFFNDLADELDEYREKFDNGAEFTQEEVDEMVEMFNELNDIMVETVEELESLEE